jgi:hypothetical protein
MNKWKITLFSAVLISLLVSACSASPEEPALKAIVPETASAETPTVIPAEPQVIEAPAAKPVPVVGWLGKVVSAPADAPYEDILVLSPETVGELGIQGANEDMEAEILALRDKPEPGQYAHFWGNLVCGVEDHNGCQIVVERIRVGATATDPEPVENWQGILIPAEFNSGDSTVFVLKGSYAMWYSIHSNDPAVLQQILDLRGTDQVVIVSGELLTGVPDVNGARIQASSITLTGEAQAVDQPNTASQDPRADWQFYQDPGGKYTFRFPPAADIIVHGIEGFPTDELPDGMTPDEYMIQLREQHPDPLCVEVLYVLGYFTINSPENLERQYTPCGRTGVGAGETQEKSQIISIAGKEYTAEGFEFQGGGDSLDAHNETLHVMLDNGLRIEFGALPRIDATWQDYLMKGKPLILEILAGMEMMP